MTHAGSGPLGANRLLLTVIALGVFIRLALASVSLGTNDALIWEHLARTAATRGLLDAYRAEPWLNHPPLAILWARVSLLAGSWFTFVMKLPGIAADAAACALVARIWLNRTDIRRSLRAAVAMAFSPVAILVSGYHCNTDNVYAFFGLLAAYALCDRRDFLLAGIALGCGLSTKLTAALLIPGAVSMCRSWRDVRHLVGGLLISSVSLLPLAAVPGEVYRNMMAYRSQVNRWGVAMFLHEAHTHQRFEGASLTLMRAYSSLGPWLILVAVAVLCAVSWWRRRWNAYELFTLIYATFLVLTPGFGIQYTVILVPLLAATSIPWTWTYGLLSGLFVFFVYWANLTSVELPLVSVFPRGVFPMPGPVFGVLAWWVLLELAVRLVLRPLNRACAPSAGTPATP